METTLHNQDRLIVWKLARSVAEITGHPYVPLRGDIIIFNTESLPRSGEFQRTQLIKRVVGLPGDRVVIHNGHLTIYNTQHSQGFEPDASYEQNLSLTSGDVDTVVPEGKIFVMGDNRANSTDSRRLGPIPVDAIIGKLVLRIAPVDQVQAF